MISRSIKIYFFYFTQFLMSRMAYKGDFFASVGASFLVAVSGVLFIVFLIDGKNVPALKGWTREEVLFIYGYSMIPMAFFSTLAPNLYDFSNRYIIEGQFDRVLLRPLNSLCQVIFESFNLEAIGSLLVGLSLLWYATNSLQIEYGFLDFVWLLLSSFSGAIILLGVFIFLSSLSFHFEDRMGVAPPFYNLIAFGRYPLPIFNRVIQIILSWVVPFAFVAFYPATHFLNRDAFATLCYLSPVMACLTLTIAGTAWKFGVSRYASTGS